jgi:hypothetical protein
MGSNSHIYSNLNLIKELKDLTNWQKDIPDKSYSVYKPLQDNDFAQTNLLFLPGSVEFERENLTENVVNLSHKLVADAMSRGYMPLAFALGFSVSWPELAPGEFPWRDLMPDLSFSLAQMGLPVKVNYVCSQNRKDPNYKYDCLSLLLIAKREIDIKLITILEWPVYRVIPSHETLLKSDSRLLSATYWFVHELVSKGLVRYVHKTDSSLKWLTQAALVSKRGLKVNLEKITEDSYFIIPEEGKSDEIPAYAEKWGFNICSVGSSVPGNTSIITANGEEFYNAPIPSFDNLHKDNKADKSTVCSCLSDKWLPDEEDDPDNLTERAFSVLLHPMLIGRRSLERVFDATPGNCIPSFSQGQAAVVVRYRDLNDMVGVSFQWVAVQNEEGFCYLKELVANATRELACTGIVPQSLVASYYGEVDLYRESCLSGFCEDFKLNYIRQTYHNNGNKFLDGLGFVISGHLRKGEYITSQAFKNKGDLIFMIGRSVSDLSGSVFQMVINNGDVGHTPPVDLAFEKRLVSAMAVLHQRKLIASACNVSRGGLFSALTDCALAGSLGFDITTDAELRSDAFLFNEAPGRVIITVSITNETQFIDTLIECDIPFSILGHVTKDELRIDDLSYGFVADIRQMMEHGWNTLVRG